MDLRALPPLEEPRARHQCLIYDGAPTRVLPTLAATAQKQLRNNYRCLYLHSPSMVRAMRHRLSLMGTDVARETASGRLVLTSEQQHLIDGSFDVDRMMQSLEEALHQALQQGCAGLWATGDMTWEMGPEWDFSKLLEYEWRLEEFFQQHPEMNGICQYHVDSLPWMATRRALETHRSIFFSDGLQLDNPHYIRPEVYRRDVARHNDLDCVIGQLCEWQCAA